MPFLNAQPPQLCTSLVGFISSSNRDFIAGRADLRRWSHVIRRAEMINADKVEEAVANASKLVVNRLDRQSRVAVEWEFDP